MGHSINTGPGTPDRANAKANSITGTGRYDRDARNAGKTAHGVCCENGVCLVPHVNNSYSDFIAFRQDRRDVAAAYGKYESHVMFAQELGDNCSAVHNDLVLR